MNTIFNHIVKAACSFVSSKGHYAGAITLVTWIIGSRLLRVLGFRTIALDSEFCIYFIVSYWIIGTLLYVVSDLEQ